MRSPVDTPGKLLSQATRHSKHATLNAIVLVRRRDVQNGKLVAARRDTVPIIVIIIRHLNYYPQYGSVVVFSRVSSCNIVCIFIFLFIHSFITIILVDNN